MDKVDYEAKLAQEVQKLQEYQKALLEEHAQIIAEASDGEPLLDAATVAQASTQKFLKAVDKATDQIIYLLEFADKDATRFSVARYIIDVTRLAPGTTGAEDPWDALVKKLQAQNAEE